MLLSSAVIIAVVALGFRRLANSDLDLWAGRFGIELSRGERTSVRDHLRRGRKIRFSAAAFGLFVGSLPAYMNVFSRDSAARFAQPLLGNAWITLAAVGAAISELFIVQRPNRHVARLNARRWSDYAPRGPITVLVLFSASAVAVSIFAAFAAADDLWWTLFPTLICLCAVVLTGVGLRSLVNRPRESNSAEQWDLDDAMRADGAHRLIGATMAMSVFNGSLAISEATLQSAPAMGLILVIPQYLALGWWLSLASNAKWNVLKRRSPAYD